MLCAVADRLRGTVRGADVVARLGGDEFAVLLDEPITEADVDRVIEALRRALTPR